MRGWLLLPLLAACASAPAEPPPPPELVRTLDELSEEKKRALVEAERLYRADDPAFAAVRDELAQDPETAYWFTHVLVRDLVVVWDRAEANEERLLRSATGERNPVLDRALLHFDAMGASTVECLVEDVMRSQYYETREVGVRLLARLGEPALPAIGELARNPDPKTRRLAAEVLENMEEPAPSGYGVLVRQIAEDSDFTVRAAAVKAMVHGGDAEAALMRRLMLQDPDEFVRRTAATSILAYPDVAAAETLVQYMEQCIQRDDLRGVEAADASLRRLAGRRESADLATWKNWLRTLSGTVN